VYIDEKGNVFSCCRSKPALLGSIYLKRLEKIYNDRIIQELRQKSLNGQLECFAKCNLLNKEKIGEPRKTLGIDYYTDLRGIRILFGKACHISCIMCGQNHQDRECIDAAKLINNVNFEPFKNIEIQGGEPLFIPEVKLFFDSMAAKNKKLSFLTNGLLVNDEWAEKIALNCSFIHFSINAATKKTHELINRGSCWETVLRNIQKVRDAKAKHHTSVRIHGHMTLVPQNIQEIPLFIRSFKQLGFDSIGFGYDKKLPGYLDAHPLLKKKISLEIKEAISQSVDKSPINRLRLKYLRLV
jgi:MoaA/NifB/PqqE/SkfB family radical SAM enzyme